MYLCDFEEKYKKPLIIFLISFAIIIPIFESINTWSEHPKTLTCSSIYNTCNLKTYSYKHSICWDYILSPRYTGCRLPKLKTSETNLIPLSEIENYHIEIKNKTYNIYLKGKNGEESYIASYKTKQQATDVASEINRYIKRWQEDTPIADSELDDNDYYYKFIEYDY